MSECSQYHLTVDKFGFGKCSVPMWSMGLPAGFCDREAYGEPAKTYTHWSSHSNPYVPGLACPGHGGPNIRIFRDGASWCAVRPGFINLQESLSGFGESVEAAISALLAVEQGEP